MSESSPPRTPTHSTTSDGVHSPITPFYYEKNPDDPDEIFPRSGRKKEQDGTPVTTNSDATRILDKGVLKRAVKEIEEQKEIEKKQKNVLKKLEKDVEELYKQEEKEQERLDENEKRILDKLNEEIEKLNEENSSKGGKKSKKYRKRRFRKTSKYKGGNKSKRSIKRHTKK